MFALSVPAMRTLNAQAEAEVKCQAPSRSFFPDHPEAQAVQPAISSGAVQYAALPEEKSAAHVAW